MPGKFSIVLLFIAFSIATVAQPLSKADKQLLASFDTLLMNAFKANEPGATAIVSRKGQVIYKKAFGMADMELNVPMQADMIFRIGSISKQFTGVAILQLVEKGKLSLQDDIKKFIPDYPTHGYAITVEHLLTHTSGIKSYTGMMEFESMMRKDMKPLELIDVFKNQPMEFAPGSKWNYNNSGYILLGYIIEKVSGKSYEQYVLENLFVPAGMTRSGYGNDSRIILNRAKGYQQGEHGFENAKYLSMTLPYAAGSLISTVEDLWKWNQALHSYKLVSKESLQKAFTDYKLSDGKSTRYGYGWSFSDIQGSASIEHGGGINGFVTDGIYLPAEDIFIAVFANCDCRSLDMLAPKMAALTLGKPYDQKEIAIDEATTKEYTGVYENEAGEQRIITVEGAKLTSQRAGGSKHRIKPYEKDKFFFENSLSSLRFTRNTAGQIEKAYFKSRTEESEWKKTGKSIPASPDIIKLDAAALAVFVGEYELAPNFVMTVSLEGDKLMVKATGQSAVEVFAETTTRFFPKEIDAKLEFFKDESGKVTHLILYQGGRETKGNKTK
ncbi:MAG: serine hydrolase [Chitinophagaceae bacterium]|nr:serine hydrolase [Chitinophagaceae bacterium]